MAPLWLKVRLSNVSGGKKFRSEQEEADGERR